MPSKGLFNKLAKERRREKHLHSLQLKKKYDKEHPDDPTFYRDEMIRRDAARRDGQSMYLYPF